MTTEERLENLERGLAETKALAERAKRRTRAGLVGMGLIAAVSVLGLIGAHGCEPPANTVRVPRLVLVDDEGCEWAALEMDYEEGGPALLLYRGWTLTPSVRLGLRVDGSQLLLFDENGEPRAELAVGEEGPALTLSDAAGKPRALLSVDADGPRLRLCDEKGKEIWRAP